jgi:hypothetical protein
VVPSYMRFAAGGCALAVGLLIAGTGGATALAAPNSGGSSSHGHSHGNTGGSGQNGSNQNGGTGSGSTGGATGTVPKTLPGVPSTLGSGHQQGQQPATGTGTPTTSTPTTGTPTTGTTTRTRGTGLAALIPNLVAAVPRLITPLTGVITPVTGVVAPVTNVVAPVTNVVAPLTNVVPNVVTPLTNVVAAAPNLVAAVPNLIAAVPNVVPDVIAPVTDVVDAVPGLLASVPNDVVVPVTTDVVTTIQDLLTSATVGFQQFAQVPSDLASLLGVAGAQPVLDGLAGAQLSSLAAPAVPAQFPADLTPAVTPGLPLAGNATGVATLEGIVAPTFGAAAQLNPDSSVPGMAPPAANGIIPVAVKSFLHQAYKEILRSPSLGALAAVALPGVAGLLILTGAGVRVGYRQARAGFALRTASIARFVRPEPVGFARPRAVRVVRPAGLRAGRLLDEAA